MPSVSELAQNDNDDLIEGVHRMLARAVGKAVSSNAFADVERTALEIGNEAIRRVLEAALQRSADRDAASVTLGVETYRRHEVGTVKYHSLCGPLVVKRATYRRVGVRNGPTIVPLELREGLIERATPAFAYVIARGYAKDPTRSVRSDLIAAHRQPPSRATLERMAKAIGLEAKELVPTIEESVRAAEMIPDETVAITLGLDRTSVPMEELDEEADEGEARVCVRYRMAYVGTVALTNQLGDVMHAWRYAVPAHEGPQDLIQRMMSDVDHALEQRPELHVGLVQDGAPELWNLMEEALASQPRVKRLHKAIDLWHLMERIAKALEVVEPSEQKRSQQLRRWTRRLTVDDSTITDIANYFELRLSWLRKGSLRRRRQAMSQGVLLTSKGYFRPLPPNVERPAPPPPRPPNRWSDEQRGQLESILGNYLLTPRLFRYASFTRLGLHVGSGVTEGACKSLIAARTKRSGQRWRKDGISAVLTLRSILESGRFDAFWESFTRRRTPLAAAA
jgi:hypothetical protein